MLSSQSLFLIKYEMNATDKIDQGYPNAEQ